MNFAIKSGVNTPVSDAFLQAGITSFMQACAWTKQFPYGRNSNRYNPMLVLHEQRGTCSSKHALLAMLVQEQQHTDSIVLMLGIFAMSAHNTPAIKEVLQAHDLPYIPEAHCYLRVDGQVLDVTSITPIPFEAALLFEQVITPQDVAEEKVAIHRRFIANWIHNENISAYGQDDLWHIREQCIAALV